MKRLPVSPLISRAIDVAEKHLGMDELAQKLVAPPSAIEAWRAGLATMPDRKFLKLVDILNELVPDWTDKPGG